MTSTKVGAVLLCVCVSSFAQSVADKQAVPGKAQAPAKTTSGVSAPATVHASEAEVRTMFEAMHMRENNQKFLQGMMPYLDREARQQAAGFASMDDADKNYFKQVEDEEMKKLVEPAFVDSIVDASVPAYAERLSPDDVKAITAFYSSPAGQRFQDQLPSITKGAMQVAMPLVQKRAQEIANDERKRLNDYMTKKYGTTAPSTSLIPDAKGSTSGGQPAAPATQPTPQPK
ncbi:MAG: hypothetical protein NVS9B15_23940 [Acidobacteriaceae bacterium]